MPPRNLSQRSNPAQAAARSFLINDQMNQLLLDHLNPQAWRAKLPGIKGRTIADIFSHVHNMRCKWLRLSAPHLKLPPQLTALTALSRRQKKPWPRAPVSARKCWKKLSLPADASRLSFATAGHVRGNPASRCWLTWLRTRPTIADRLACSPTNSDSVSPSQSVRECGTGRGWPRSDCPGQGY